MSELVSKILCGIEAATGGQVEPGGGGMTGEARWRWNDGWKQVEFF